MVPITSVLTGQIILACWVIFLMFWIITSFFAKKTAERAGWAGNWIVARMGIVIVIIVVLIANVPWLTDTQLWGYTTTIGAIADAFAICGLLIMLWSRVVLGSNWSGSVVFKENHELIQHGPYAMVRHPIYTGLFLLFVGEAIWYGTSFWFIVLLVVIVSTWFKAQREEALMTKHFPQEYPAYRARTKAIIPFIL